MSVAAWSYSASALGTVAFVPVEIGQHHVRVRSRGRSLDRRRQVVGGGARLLRERQVLAEPRAVGEPVVARELQRPVDRFQPLGHGACAERGRERSRSWRRRSARSAGRRAPCARWSRPAAIPGLARARPPAPDRRSRGRRRNSRRRRGSAAGRSPASVTSRCGSRSSSSSKYRVSSGSERLVERDLRQHPQLARRVSSLSVRLRRADAGVERQTCAEIREPLELARQLREPQPAGLELHEPREMLVGLVLPAGDHQLGSPADGQIEQAGALGERHEQRGRSRLAAARSSSVRETPRRRVFSSGENPRATRSPISFRRADSAFVERRRVPVRPEGRHRLGARGKQPIENRRRLAKPACRR